MVSHGGHSSACNAVPPPSEEFRAPTLPSPMASCSGSATAIEADARRPPVTGADAVSLLSVTTNRIGWVCPSQGEAGSKPRGTCMAKPTTKASAAENKILAHVTRLEHRAVSSPCVMLLLGCCLSPAPRPSAWCNCRSTRSPSPDSRSARKKGRQKREKVGAQVHR